MSAGSATRGRAIWLASYPKSGNTWLRLLLKSLQEHGGPVALSDLSTYARMPIGRHLFDGVLEADSGSMTEAEIEALRPAFHDAHFGAGGPDELCKVHDCWFRTPEGRAVFDRHHTRAALYIVRDPRDVAVSWARFMGRSIDWAVQFMADRAARLQPPADRIGGGISQRLGNWSDHVLSWVDESGLDPLVIRYEDMHADLPATLARVVVHLGWDATPSAIAGAVAATRFERLADEEARSGFRQKPASAERFFHTGRSGGWRDVLDPDQAARIVADHEGVMRRFGYL
ncbi:sulfotransferase domain-containing protein [Sphingomonas sp. MMS24-J45]|uniref:sulfotransferase domain-containing protein n=1 Tax=Sphingomonas sp. MMS24-J45 TaxID=3238806 RepID=UPI00384D2083